MRFVSSGYIRGVMQRMRRGSDEHTTAPPGRRRSRRTPRMKSSAGRTSMSTISESRHLSTSASWGPRCSRRFTSLALIAYTALGCGASLEEV
jgi:hypothetical protein